MIKKIPKNEFLKLRINVKEKLIKLGHNIEPWQKIYYTTADHYTFLFKF